LKQQKGEVNGGAKASRAGRPWICACIICGFTEQTDHLSKQSEDPSLPLLPHRQAALKKVKTSPHCTHLQYLTANLLSMCFNQLHKVHVPKYR